METTKVKKGNLKKIGNIIFWVVLGIIVLYSAIALFSTDDGVTKFFGRTGLTVQSESMTGTFNKGDLIIINTDFNVDDLKVGDVITFEMPVTVDDQIVWIYNSHRIVDIQEDANGNLHFFTKGDNNPDWDTDPTSEAYVLGVWHDGDTVIPKIGGIIDGVVGFLKSPTGFLIFIVLPCFAFLVYEIVRFIRIMTEYNVQKTLGDRVKMQEEALAMARAQLEAENAQKNSESQKE